MGKELKRTSPRRRWSTAPLVALAIFLSSAHAVDCAAAENPELPWGPPISTTVNGQEVAEFLRDFCGAQDISVSVSEGVKGVVNASFENRAPAEIFDSITKAYGLVPYYDGSILYVYTAAEMTSTVIALEKLETTDFRQLLTELRILDPNHTFRELAAQKIVYVSGPPRYVELLEELGQKFDQRAVVEEEKETVEGAKIEVRYFKLSYASADDTTIDFRDEQVVVPGVARLLSHVLGKGGPQLVESGGASRENKPPTVKKLKGAGLIEGKVVPVFEEPSASTETAASGGESSPTGGAPAEGGGSAPPRDDTAPTEVFIQADTRSNAVVIADRASRMPLYEKIIKDLDQPSKVIEINAAIIEMNTNANLTWGVDYRSLNAETLETNSQGDPSTTGTFRLGQNTNADLADGVDLISGSGLNASAALIGTTWQILARIKALEEAGEAQVLSRPSVMTIDNTEAVLRDDSTIYVRVAGLAEVDLFPVSAGVMLRVTPHLIEASKAGEPTKIRLIVNIEDGDFTPQNVDEIPSVRRSEISTQAIIAENESLLIGGQYRHQQSNGEVGVPVAGRVPVLGLAFKNKRVINNKRQRLFLISPRIIDPDEYYRRAESISARIMSAPPLEASDPVKTPADAPPVFATEGAPSGLERGAGPDLSAPMTRATPVSEEEPAFESTPAKPNGNLFQRLFTPTRTP